MAEMTGTVAIWVPDGPITREEMTACREAFEQALAEHADTVVLTLSDPDRVVTCRRQIIRLPIFIESHDAEAAESLAQALSQRADRRRPH